MADKVVVQSRSAQRLPCWSSTGTHLGLPQGLAAEHPWIEHLRQCGGSLHVGNTMESISRGCS